MSSRIGLYHRTLGIVSDRWLRGANSGLAAGEQLALLAHKGPLRRSMPAGVELRPKDD